MRSDEDVSVDKIVCGVSMCGVIFSRIEVTDEAMGELADCT